MTRAANVRSIAALRQFIVDLRKYELEVRQALTELQLESRRGMDWLEHDRAKYWPAEVRRSSDAVIEAMHSLERCELTTRTEDRPSCTAEKVALERAKRRKRHCEEKVESVRRFVRKLRHDVDEFEALLSKLNVLLDKDIPAATAALSRMANALEKYARVGRPETEDAHGNRGETGRGPTDSVHESY